MELQQFKIFESVSRHLNITSAATELGISQPAASLQLKQLEKECGVQLYTRNNRGVELTRQGHALLGVIKLILTQLDKVDKELRAERRQIGSRTFVVGSSNTLSATVLPEILVEFSRLNPTVNLVVETADSRHMGEMVRNGTVEAALITSPADLPGCACEPYMVHEAVAFVPPDNPLCRKTLTLQELCRIPLVVRHGSSTVKELRRRGYELNFAAQFGAIEAVKTAVRGGMGVGVLFRSRLESELARGELKVIDVAEFRSIVLQSFVVYKRSRPSSNARKFLDLLGKRRR
jgi:DNA-binding transcriptional LysR family regulator